MINLGGQLISGPPHDLDVCYLVRQDIALVLKEEGGNTSWWLQVSLKVEDIHLMAPTLTLTARVKPPHLSHLNPLFTFPLLPSSYSTRATSKGWLTLDKEVVIKRKQGVNEGVNALMA